MMHLGTSLAAAARPADVEGFTNIVAPFLQKHCIKCHGEKKHKGEIYLHNLNGKLSAGEDSTRWAKVLEMLTLGEMPPKKEVAPDRQTVKLVMAWIRTELHKAGRSIDDKLLLPGYGNLVDHQKLFHPPPGAVVSPPRPRFWRINPYVFSGIVYELTKRGVSNPFSLGSSGSGFKDYAVLFGADEPTTSLLLRTAGQIAIYQSEHKIVDGKIQGGWRTPREILTLLDPRNQTPTDEQMEAAIVRQYHLVLQRDPTDDELQRLLAFTRKNIAQTGRLRGVRTMLAAVLLTPEALYRVEFGEGKPDEHGRIRLSPREIAYAIAYALTDKRPDQQLLKAAEEGKLATRQLVAAQVRRMLDNEKTEKPRIMRFFREYFQYPAAIDVFKDKETFRHHKPEILISDTEHLIQYILDRDKDVFVELLTTNKSFVNYRYDAKKNTARPAHAKTYVHLSYGLPVDWKWTPNQPIELPENERTGILTQPSWLVAQSVNFDNHAIRRGKWVRERLVGGLIPDVRITFDAKFPDDPDKTLRQKMEVTTTEVCWHCHDKMNAFGLPFEQYDHFGRFRTRELGKKVDTTGGIDNGGDPKIEGPVKNPIEMIRKLAGSRHVQQVFIRHAFRYWMGRNETLDDGPALVAADVAYTESDGSMKTLIVSLLTSDSFLYRAPRQATAR